MGHGIIAYTADLSIRYCKPVKTKVDTLLKTTVASVSIGRLYTMKCIITQNKDVIVKGKGKFIKVPLTGQVESVAN